MSESEDDMRRNCSICLTPVEEESASVLAMGGYGTPKCLCDACASLIDTVSGSRDYDSISSAMDAITDKMSRANIDDRVTVSTVTDILKSGAERARAIKDGTYDFSLDDQPSADGGLDDIPDELRETEEDRLLDEKEARANKKFDTFLNYAWVAVGAVALVVIALKIFGVL